MEFVLNRARCIVSFDDATNIPFFSKFEAPSQSSELRVIGEGKQRVVVDVETATWLKTQDKQISWIRDGKGISGVCLGSEEADTGPLEEALARVDLAKEEGPSIEQAMENLSVNACSENSAETIETACNACDGVCDKS